jgi:hypothetical protein
MCVPDAAGCLEKVTWIVTGSMEGLRQWAFFLGTTFFLWYHRSGFGFYKLAT